jgi:hypothetical protein
VACSHSNVLISHAKKINKMVNVKLSNDILICTKYGSLIHYGPIGVEMYLINLVGNEFIKLHYTAKTINMPSSVHLQPI